MEVNEVEQLTKETLEVVKSESKYIKRTNYFRTVNYALEAHMNLVNFGVWNFLYLFNPERHGILLFDLWDLTLKGNYFKLMLNL